MSSIVHTYYAGTEIVGGMLLTAYCGNKRHSLLMKLNIVRFSVDVCLLFKEKFACCV